ncbi:anaerobic C4-dicarboxylate transporter family protein [Enterobacter sp. RHBSTW-01064]|uniref:anaerobic C4-dicarboxylate transporter family protein n=1 Tax=Enterobacter sp. RHBSTW-01064 TaxID=2742679 RepID=UPI002018130E|nr:anaerobic C4-dicarboxylate transporter family protein [Enterobacter sp. RHBSTW-01064]
MIRNSRGELLLVNMSSCILSRKKEFVASAGAKKGVVIFAIGVVLVLILGSFTELLPSGMEKRLSTPMVIQMVMLTAALFIMIVE